MTGDSLDLQTHFQDYLMHDDEHISTAIVHAEDINSEERLSIYYDGYRLRLIEALSEDFSTIEAILGEDEFAEICEIYIHKHPSEFKTLRHFGIYFADFLKNYQRDDFLDFLSEMAVLE